MLLAIATLVGVSLRSPAPCGSAAADPVRRRTVQVTADLAVTVWELAQPADLVNAYNAGHSMPDPFGVVLWPGALFAARRLCSSSIEGKTILCMGTGTGLEALTAAALGANVIACDINLTTLQLLGDAAREQGLGDRIETRAFDLCSDAPPPRADVHVFADVLYNGELAAAVGRRCREELWSGAAERLLVSDSQRFASTSSFLEELNAPAGSGVDMRTAAIEWSPARVDRFTGSGILVDADQTYDVQLRYVDADLRALRERAARGT